MDITCIPGIESLNSTSNNFYILFWRHICYQYI